MGGVIMQPTNPLVAEILKEENIPDNGEVLTLVQEMSSPTWGVVVYEGERDDLGTTFVHHRLLLVNVDNWLVSHLYNAYWDRRAFPQEQGISIASLHEEGGILALTYRREAREPFFTSYYAVSHNEEMRPIGIGAYRFKEAIRPFASDGHYNPDLFDSNLTFKRGVLPLTKKVVKNHILRCTLCTNWFSGVAACSTSTAGLQVRELLAA